jgi:PAS domain S-box-containing protein
MPIEAALRPILDTVLDAVVVMDRDGVVRAWNQHAEATFGWTASEAMGRNLGELMVPPALRKAHHDGLARFNREGVAKVLDRRLELTGLHRDGSEIPVELSITLLSRDGGDLFVGFLRDISERRRAEAQLAFQVRESRLMFELSELASRDGGVTEALVAALDAICELAEWPVGHAFLVADDGIAMRSGPWSSNASAIAPALVEHSEAMQFASGIGLPGRVLKTGAPLWMSRAASEEDFPRRGLGFESGFAFPVSSGGRCVAIMEFFSQDPREPEQPLLLSARAIGAQVGRVFERKTSQELQNLLLAELNHRSKNILAVVSGMAHLSFNSATDLHEAQRIFDRRLDSIAKANDILHRHSGQAALLGDIVQEALLGCGVGEERASVSGPELCVDSSTAIMVSLAVHELSTNAFKYGALSSDDGRIAIRWNANARDPLRFDFEWVESGGPAVADPGRSGFGTRILGRAIEGATGGSAVTGFDAGGLHYRLTGARHSGSPGDRAKAA